MEVVSVAAIQVVAVLVLIGKEVNMFLILSLAVLLVAGSFIFWFISLVSDSSNSLDDLDEEDLEELEELDEEDLEEDNAVDSSVIDTELDIPIDFSDTDSGSSDSGFGGGDSGGGGASSDW